MIHRDTPPSDTLRSVGSALDVLDCFSLDPELGVSDIARRLGIAKSTAHRLLATLSTRGLVEKNPESGQYRLGLHLFELGQLAQQRLKLRQVALPFLEELRQVTGHTVHLGVLDGADVVYAERLESPDCRRLMNAVPRRFPSDCTSSGKVIAAFNPELAQRRLTMAFPPRAGAPRTAHAYRDLLTQTHRIGVGITHGEVVSGVSSVAAPIRDLNGKAYAAVSLVGPTTRMLGEMDRSARLVTAVSKRISGRLTVAC